MKDKQDKQKTVRQRNMIKSKKEVKEKRGEQKSHQSQEFLQRLLMATKACSFLG